MLHCKLQCYFYYRQVSVTTFCRYCVYTEASLFRLFAWQWQLILIALIKVKFGNGRADGHDTACPLSHAKFHLGTCSHIGREFMMIEKPWRNFVNIFETVLSLVPVGDAFDFYSCPRWQWQRQSTWVRIRSVCLCLFICPRHNSKTKLGHF